MNLEKKIFSIGTGRKSIEEFIELLKGYEIKSLVDVRRFPISRRFPHFTMKSLEERLKEEGFSYFYLGEELGGYRKGGYENYILTDSFKEGIKKLLSVAEKVTTAFFCSETLPWRCHRRFIGMELEKMGWEVYHIISLKKVWRMR